MREKDWEIEGDAERESCESLRVALVWLIMSSCGCLYRPDEINKNGERKCETERDRANTPKSCTLDGRP